MIQKIERCETRSLTELETLMRSLWVEQATKIHDRHSRMRETALSDLGPMQDPEYDEANSSHLDRNSNLADEESRLREWMVYRSERQRVVMANCHC